MLRNKQSSKKDRRMSTTFHFDSEGRSLLEYHLLDFLDSFDIYQFLLDPSYRKQLNNLLDCFSDEEFEDFERLYSHRFTVN